MVADGGSPEIEVALRLKEYAASLPGREQLAGCAVATTPDAAIVAIW